MFYKYLLVPVCAKLINTEENLAKDNKKRGAGATREIAKREAERAMVMPEDKKVYELALIHCTASEIASCLGCSRETIYEHYADVLHRGHEHGQKSLKRKMHEIAEAGDVKMLIWLSKQRLGYRDTIPESAQVINFNVQVNEVPL